MRAAWVIGASGLLGSSLCAVLRAQGASMFVPAERFAWGDAERVEVQMGVAVRAFAAVARNAAAWELYWAAGQGTMGSAAGPLAAETQALGALLAHLGREAEMLARPGVLGFASSAGAIYAGSGDAVITERSEVAPNTAYAREKLVQEDMVRRFTADRPATGALIARMSTLYGTRGQGLLARMSRSVIRHEPLHVFVPFDTMRDYLWAEDAARAMVANARACALLPGGGALVKIIASERPTTVAEIISFFKRTGRRKPLIVTGTSRLSGLYPRYVQFKSVVAIAETGPPTSLAVGIARMLDAERARHGCVGQGRTPPTRGRPDG